MGVWFRVLGVGVDVSVGCGLGFGFRSSFLGSSFLGLQLSFWLRFTGVIFGVGFGASTSVSSVDF